MHISSLAARSAAAFLVGWCSGTAALAEATASAHAGTPTLSYTDLAPFDGVTPLLAWTAGQTTTWSQAATASPQAYAYNQSEGLYAPTSVSLRGALGTTEASTGALGAAASATLVGSTTAGVYQDLQSSAHPVGWLAFSVTPMTVVTFMLPVSLSAATTIGSQSGNGEWASASASMLVTVDLGHGAWDNLAVSREVSTGHTYDFQTWQLVTAPTSTWTEGVMSLTVVNGSSAAVQGSLSVQTSTMVDSAIPMSAVPEPPAFALALAGAAALAGVARRRLARR